MALDKDHDGEISAAEMRPPQATPTEQAEHFLGENDGDKDGKISKAEAPERMQAQFDAIDKNHDGYLDREELIAYFGSQGGGRGGPPMGQGQREMMPGNSNDGR
jgi:Ca2+-binding EF-hand superfamily protein